ncbi:hypothetical protein ACFOKI_16475 [Sphingomonas qilianensis]|uniref:Uncharacterized protein n=1 Tax=Sphingomonas qilianensis TaxID=1736690 RepID=A0ABU9XWQ8_9SPHN
MLALLARDLADVPADRLERAITEWVRTERWMPKAADLVDICQRHQRDDLNLQPEVRGVTDEVAAFVDARNALLAHAPKGRKDIEWFVDASGQAKLRYKGFESISPDRVPVEDVDRYNSALSKFGADFRWDCDGRMRLLKEDPEPDGRDNAGPAS